MSKTITKEFIQKSELKHQGKYTYEKTIYKNSKVNVVITCPTHGDFEQMPNSHLRGSNCPGCAQEIKKNKLKKPFQQFSEEATKLFKGGFTYNESKYKGMKKPIIITCAVHGDFTTTPSAHMRNANGMCKLCINYSKQIELQNNFVRASTKLHNNIFDYSKVNYINADTKVTIICPIHGEFQQTPEGHISGYGCNTCAILHRAKNKTLTTEEWIINAKAIHGDKYDYSKVVYTGARNKIEVICKIHGKFEVAPGNHVTNKSGCPSCATSGFDSTKQAYLYYLKITTDTNQILYKIGITNRTVNERFQLKDLQKIEIVKQKLYDNGQDALDWEQYLLKKYKQYQYQGPKVLESGNTELFTEDILSMYYA